MATPASDRAWIRGFKDTDQKEPLVPRGSPLAAAMGAAILSVDPKKMSIRVRFTPSELFVLARGVIQGGAVATMLDFSMSFITISMIPEGKANATASLNVNYLKPALPGTYFCEARIERLGRTLVFLSASLGPEGGDPVATATAVFSVFDPPRPRPAA